MSLINISSFNGLRPVMEPRLLGLDEATVARNVRLTPAGEEDDSQEI